MQLQSFHHLFKEAMLIRTETAITRSKLRASYGDSLGVRKHG